MFSRFLRPSRSTAAWRIAIWTWLAFALGSALAFAITYAAVARSVRERSDAWLSGEAEVLSRVSNSTPQDLLYDRTMEEVAELATHEPGFPPDLRNDVFERFVKVKHSRGRGLGPAFVKAVAQAHGGSVKITDRQGGGAITALSLPASLPED